MMDAFSYLSVLLSIILGLAITQVLQGYRAILLARGRVRLSAPVLIWSGLILLFATQAWWASFGLRERHHWDFLAFSIILLQMVLLYMLSAVIFPEFGPHDTIDLVDHFERHKAAFFGTLVAMLAVSILKELVLEHRLPTTLNLAFHVALATIALIGVKASSSRAQMVVVLAALAGFLSYVALLFAQL